LAASVVKCRKWVLRCFWISKWMKEDWTTNFFITGSFQTESMDPPREGALWGTYMGMLWLDCSARINTMVLAMKQNMLA